LNRHCEHSDQRFALSEHRLREAIQKATSKDWIASSLTLAMTIGMNDLTSGHLL